MTSTHTRNERRFVLHKIIKSSAVGRGEGFGVTNGMVTARSGLMSPHSLTSTKNAQPTLPMAGTMPLGQLAQPAASTIGSPVGMPKAVPASVLPNTSMVNKSGNSSLVLKRSLASSKAQVNNK